MPNDKPRWSDRILLWCLAAYVGIFWVGAAYGISHWRGAPFSPAALTAVFIVTGVLALLLLALLNGSRK